MLLNHAHRRAALLGGIFLFPLLLLGLLLPVLNARAAPADKIATDLRDAVAAQPAAFHHVLFFLSNQAPTPAPDPRLPRGTRAAVVVDALQSVAEATQGPLLAALAAETASGDARDVRPLWIVNAVAAAVSPAALARLSARADVAAIQLDAAWPLLTVPLSATSGVPLSTTWGVAASGAAHVQAGLGIDGSGVTIALMDSGVDWTHPDLRPGYRGVQPDGSVIHAGNWFDAAHPQNLQPFDDDGHGTDVAGSAVGRGGIGVAPGASWIAVKISDDAGSITISAVHAAYQWLLAPNGDSARAPDIVSGSWGTPDGSDSSFLPDVAALHAAGILQVYAAGNNGPFGGTVNAPASFPQSLAVAAHDQEAVTAWFSARGPSPLDSAPHPALAAPGALVWSTRSGGGYALGTGTSMATPHVSGAAALLFSAAPGLDAAQVTRLLTTTAQQIGSNYPSLASGWGMLDAYGAVAAVGSSGTLAGRLTAGGLPLANVLLTVTTPSAVQLPFRTAPDGTFRAPLASGVYTLTTRPFGYGAVTVGGLQVSATQTTTENIVLSRLPSGRLSGVVRDADQQPVAGAQIRVPGTPVSTTTAGDGRYLLTLPAGSYTVEARRNGLRLGRAALTVAAGSTQTADFALQPAPRILLVDGGRYLFLDTWRVYDAALADAGYVADRWPILDPFQSNPLSPTLNAYDVVIWSAPEYGPEITDWTYGAVLAEFVDRGGRLLVSGQDVALYSGGGLPPAEWWALQLGAHYLGRATPPYALTGVPDSALDGLSLTLNGGDSAYDQVSPDAVAPAANSLAEPLLTYADGRAGALYRDLCIPGDIAFYGFGLEGIAAAEARSALLAATFDRFAAPDAGPGGRFMNPAVDDFALPGSAITVTLDIANVYQAMTDTFSLALAGDVWPAALVSPTLDVGPCAQRQVALRLDVPADAAPATMEQLTITLRSALRNEVVDELVVRQRIPAGGVLLVDDDRFYNVEQAYGDALTAAGVSFETWEIGWDNNVRGSPPQQFLNAYETIIWFNGYDFAQPLSGVEREALTAFLAHGGRLFFSSQDFLYYHHNTSLARDYFGVQAYRESVTPTLLYPAEPLAGIGEPAVLDYGPYMNNGDGLLPRDPATVALWDGNGLPAATAVDGDAWRAVFWAVPWEVQSPAAQERSMGQILGWLGDLHASSWIVNRRSGPWDAAIPRVYTLTLRRDDASAPGPVLVTNTLPAELSLEPGTLSGGWRYDALNHALTWRGVVTPGVPLQLSYAALPATGSSAGTPIHNRVLVRDGPAAAQVPYEVVSWPGGPDLGRSNVGVAPAALAPPGDRVTATLQLANAEDAVTALVSATWQIPDTLRPISETLQSSGGAATLVDDEIRWTGTIAPGATETIVVGLSTTTGSLRAWHPLVATIDDGVSTPQLRTTWLFTRPEEQIFPIVLWSYAPRE